MRFNINESIIAHYSKNWDAIPAIRPWNRGLMRESGYNFRILEFKPTENRPMWTYATCGMSANQNKNRIELHIFSPEKNDALIELLSAVAHFHLTSTTQLGIAHTINFGRSWLLDSICNYGLISLPYLDGLSLEELTINNELINFYWLIPISEKERAFKIDQGLEALEEQFELAHFDYCNPARKSVI